MCIATAVGLAASATSANAADPTPSPVPSSAPDKLNTYKVAPSTFGIGPADAKKPDGRPYFTFAVTPGAQIADHVAVANISTQPIALAIYPTTVSNNTAGDFAFSNAGQKLTDAGSWIRLVYPTGKSTFVIPARTTAILPVELKLPPNASPGDHSAGIVADLTVVAKTDKTGHNVTTTLHQRVGVRVFIRVAGPIRPGLTIEHLHATYHGGLDPIGKGYSTVTYTVHNVGNVNLGARQSVDVHGLFGSTARAKGLAEIPLLLPGGSVKQTVRISGVVPEIHESATVRLTPIHLPSDVDPGLTNTTLSDGFWAVPWMLVSVVLLLVVIGALERRRRRRTRQRWLEIARSADHASASTEVSA